MNQRALEPSALAMLKWMHGQQATFEHFAPGIKAGLLEQAEECITAYEAHMKAEGFVVVRAEPSETACRRGLDAYWGVPPYRHRHLTARTTKEIEGMADAYRAMLSAATTGENDASNR